MLVALLYVAYTASRLLAARDHGPALDRARRLLNLESMLRLDREHAIVHFFVAHKTIALLSCYWYSAAHYLVTPVVLYWLYRRGQRAYLPARRALMIATMLGLSAYLLFPTAPPRMLAGYADILSLHASAGWWGEDASAPRGLASLTNELAAFPSLHAGWSLWVALTTQRWGRRRAVRIAGWLHAAITAIVVIGTANHWILDLVGGWLVVAVGWVMGTRCGSVLSPYRAWVNAPIPPRLVSPPACSRAPSHALAAGEGGVIPSPPSMALVPRSGTSLLSTDNPDRTRAAASGVARCL
jgi:hypothetical protein